MSFRHVAVVVVCLTLCLHGAVGRNKRETASGFCQPGWSHHGRKCFKFSENAKTWDAAKSACETYESGYLAEIYSSEENAFLETTGKAITTLTTGVWFGLKWNNAKDTFYWVTSGNLYTYRNWLGGWGTGFAYQYCYKFDQSNGLWSQQDCTTNLNYICEKDVSDDSCTHNPCKNGGTCTRQSDSYSCSCTSQFSGTNCEKACPSGWTQSNGRCYIYKNENANWAEAKTSCSNIGGTLVQIDSAAVNTFLYNLRNNNYQDSVLSIREAWIGLGDIETENTFKWDRSQQVASYFNWSTNEPNSGAGYGDEDCVEMLSSGKWNDYYCFAIKSYFCERSPTITA